MSGQPGLGVRLRRAAAAAARTRGQRRAAALTARLEARNRTSRAPVVGTLAVVLSLTSHGKRLDTVHLAIESIAAGSVRPRRLILWVDDERFLAQPSDGIRRLQERGLELRLTRDLGPYKKSFPTLAELGPDDLLVTADDDQLYPRTWLAALAAAARRWPTVVHCHRARVVSFDGDQIAPYARWPMAYTTRPRFRHFATGASGVIYPRRVIEAFIAGGEGFLDVAPRADDIWLHRIAVDAGVRIAQVSAVPKHYPIIPGSQAEALNTENLRAGANDSQLAATYTATTIARLRADVG